MPLKNLAENFHHAKLTLEDHRIELFQKEKELEELKSKSFTTEDKVRLMHFADEVNFLKNSYVNEQIDVQELGILFFEALKDANVKPSETVPCHVKDDTWFDVWYLDNNEVCCTMGAYTRIQ